MLTVLVMFCVCLMAVLYGIHKSDSEINGKKTFAFAAVSVFALKIALALFIKGYESDLNCFARWSESVYSLKPANFYENAGFVDYPPGYMYILYATELVRHLFGIGTDGTGYNLLLKLPAIICDMLCGVMLYGFAKDKLSESKRISVALMFMLNPFVILNSSWWGQVDSVFTLAAMAALILLYGRKYVLSAVCYGLALLIKPQALIIFPVYLFCIYELISKEKIKGIKTVVLSCVSGAAVFFALALPFSGGRGIGWIFELYKNTLGSYEYASLNAPNFFGMLGANTVSVYDKLFIFDYSVWSWIFIAILTVLSGFIYFRCGTFACAAFLISGVYVFAAKMHERYLFPAVAFILLHYICTKKEKLFVPLAGFTFSVFTATAWVLYLSINTNYPYINAKSPVFILLSAICVISFFVMVYFMFAKEKEKKAAFDYRRAEIPKIKVSYGKKDVIICLLIMAVYAAVEFTMLGSFKAPQTFEEFSYGKSVVLSLKKEENISRITLYNGRTPSEEENQYAVSFSKDGESYGEKTFVSLDSVFKWEQVETDEYAKYIRLDFLQSGGYGYIGEIGIFSDNGEKLNFACEKAPALCDEPEVSAYESTYMNGTYFDEIYHARTGYEFNGGEDVYEWTHPPLGKLFIALGIKMFGMTPFGWRFFGALFGVLILPVIYCLAKEIFKSIKAAALAAVLLAADFMHFTMSRIATIDSFAAFFALLMFLFMYKFLQTDYNRDGLYPAVKYLFLSGLAFGLGVAVKWTCIYSGAGLCICFLIHMIIRFRERDGAENYVKNTVKIILYCVLYFVVIPALIYWVSYMPYAFLKSGPESIGVMFKIQKNMFDYHANLDAEHFFSSMWYQWPIMYKPMWFLSDKFPEAGKISSISAMGNPVIWWGSIVATAVFIAIIVKKIKNGEETGNIVFLIIAYMAQYLPWFFVTRVVFIYHYCNSVPFIILITVYVLKYFYDRSVNKKSVRTAVCIYAGAALAMFVIFYPIISGMKIQPEYAGALTWFDTWYFGG